MLRDGGTMEDIGFSIVKPSKDGSRPGYRRSNYDGTGGGLAGSSNDPGRSQGPGDRDGGGSTYQETQQKIREVENRRAAEDREKARIEQERIKSEYAKKEKARLKAIADKKAKEERRNKILGFAKNIPTTLKLAKKIFDPLTNIQRKKYIDSELVPGTKEYTDFMEQLEKQDAATINVPDFQQLGYTTRNLSKVDFDDGSKFGFGEGYDKYRNTIDTRFDPDNTGGGGGDNYIPPTIVPKVVDTIDDTDEDTTTGGGSDMGGLAPRFAGSIFDFDGLADGGRAGFKDGEGIMQMASAPDPMDERNSMMETIAMEEFGKPLSDLSEDEIIQIELFMEELSKIKNEPRIMAQQSGITRAGAMDGGRMMMMANQEEDDPTGGIMDLETLRNQYFFGGIVKSAKKAVKGVTRAVKKIAKSPIGKAALLYAGGTYLGGLNSLGGSGTFMSNLKSGKGIANLLNFGKTKLGFDSIMKQGAKQTTKGLFSSPFGLIAGGSLLAGALTPEEEEEKFDNYYASNNIDYDNVRNNPYKFLSARNQGSRFNVADGGIMRTGYAEGSEEPVAKKTMPLLDMDGQEMDLREEGGFVPLGRMERADDVPARLSKNEFVFTADAVRNAGEGDIDKGAEVMYNMMKNLESGGEVSQESQGLEGAREMFQTSKRLEEVI